MKATILQGLARLLAAILLTACATPLPEQPTIGTPTASKASRALQTDPNAAPDDGHWKQEHAWKQQMAIVSQSDADGHDRRGKPQKRQHGGGGGSLQTCARDRQDCERRPRAAACRS